MCVCKAHKRSTMRGKFTLVTILKNKERATEKACTGQEGRRRVKNGNKAN